MTPRAEAKKGVAIRLTLAALACAGIFLASPDSPSSSSGCGDKAYGTVSIENPTSWSSTVKFTGPGSTQTTVDPESSGSVTLQVGSYNWTATTAFSAGVHFATSGAVEVKKNTTVGIVINYD
jgi:hypothetical protein